MVGYFLPLTASRRSLPAWSMLRPAFSAGPSRWQAATSRSADRRMSSFIRRLWRRAGPGVAPEPWFARITSGSACFGQRSGLVVADRLLDLFARVHDEGTV